MDKTMLTQTLTMVRDHLKASGLRVRNGETLSKHDQKVDFIASEVEGALTKLLTLHIEKESKNG